MLEDLLTGQERSRFILIKDDVACPGRHLVLNWIRNLSKRCEHIIFVSYERPSEFFISWLPREAKERIFFIDGSFTALKEDDDILFENTIVKAVRGTSAIVFDSLTLPLFLRQVPQTCSVLHRLITNENVIQTVAVIHKDVHDHHSCDLVGFLASSVLDMTSVSQAHHKCTLRHCRVTGKAFNTVESVIYDSQFNIDKIRPWTTSSPNVPLPASQVDSLAHLSFNLSLTDNEKEARSQVKLPYLKDLSSEMDTNASSGKIIYQPDDADDIDDEDPDDDLDI